MRKINKTLLAASVVAQDSVAAKHADAEKAATAGERPPETPSQENARRTAEDYLGNSAFSRTGLIRQLMYEGYSEADAAHAVDGVHADWYEHAVKTAKDYLDQPGFSRSSLIDQLTYEGYTPQQAAYGVTKAGL